MNQTPVFNSLQEAALYDALTSPVDDHSIGRILFAARALRKMLSAEWRKGKVAPDRRSELRQQIVQLDELLVQFGDKAAIIRKQTGGFTLR